MAGNRIVEPHPIVVVNENKLKLSPTRTRRLEYLKKLLETKEMAQDEKS